MDYRERNEFKRRLRKIVLHSADVAPDEVKAYIRGVAAGESHYVKREVFKEFAPLAAHLPKEYVDFCIDFLIAKPEDRAAFDSWHGPSSRVTDYHALGIEEHDEFYPPSPTRGPFLRLLRENEDEGLRLIQTITNRAAQNWRAREQHRRHDDPEVKLTPLPVVIKLPSGTREFWGDDEVYRWFRPSSSGPHAVMSALMALELWMEEQVEAGRDANAFFEKVLSGSECAAVLGVCVSIALGYVERCLRAVLPVVSSPRVWDMDIRRLTGDLGGSLGGDLTYERQAKRDKLTQRRVDVRHLSPHYLFGADNSLRAEFEQAVAAFTENLPFPYEEARESPEAADWLNNQMRIYQSWGDRGNYHSIRTERGTELYFQQPQHLVEQNKEELSATAERNLWMRLNLWAHNIIKEGRADDQLTVEYAVGAAKQLLRPGDYNTPYVNHGGNIENWRLQAVTGVAAASLLADFDWVEKHGQLDWCRSALLAAARMPYGDYLMDSRDGVGLFDPKVSAARGLGALVTHSVADEEVRAELLRLAGDTHRDVVGSVFKGLHDAWRVDNVLCWNVLSLAFSLCLQPRNVKPPFRSAKRGKAEARWADKLVEDHLRNLRNGYVPSVPNIQKAKGTRFLWKLGERVIGDLPLEHLCQEAATRTQLLQLADDLLSWTIVEHKPKSSDLVGSQQRRERPLHLWEWNKALLTWSVRLAGLLTVEETRSHILDPVRNCWHEVPGLTADLMQQYIFTSVGNPAAPTRKAQSEWREMCGWVLDDLQQRAERRSYYESDEADAVSLIVFVRHNMALVDEGKSHINLFVDVIDRWVDLVGGSPNAYSYLLIMLSEAGRVFTPEPALAWLKRATDAAQEVRELFREHKNGARTAELLLRMWGGAEERIRRDAVTLQRFSGLVDELVPMGIPLASLLQRTLEQRS